MSVRVAEKSKTVERRRHKVRASKTNVSGWSRPTDCRKANPGKPGGAKSWVYRHDLFFCDHDCQTAEEQIFMQG